MARWWVGLQLVQPSLHWTFVHGVNPSQYMLFYMRNGVPSTPCTFNTGWGSLFYYCHIACEQAAYVVPGSDRTTVHNHIYSKWVYVHGHGIIWLVSMSMNVVISTG